MILFPPCWHPWRMFWRIVWNTSELFCLPLPKAPIVFGWCIGAKGVMIKGPDKEKP